MADALQSKTDFRKKEDKTSRNRGKVWNGHSVNKDKSRLFKTARQAEWVRMITDVQLKKDIICLMKVNI